MADLYHRYAEVFRDDPEVREFWARMAREEESHESSAALVRRVADGQDLPAEIGVSESELQEIISQAHAHIAGDPPDLDAAVRFALRLELAASEYFLTTALANVSPEIAKLVEATSKADAEHARTLVGFAHSRDIDVRLARD